MIETITVDLHKLSNVVKSDAVKKTLYDELVKKVNAIQTIDTSDLVKKTDYDTKLEETKRKIPNHDKYITTNDFNKFSGTIFGERLKTELTTNKALNTVEQCPRKNEKKLEKLQTLDLSDFLCKNFFGDDGCQNMFVYITFSMLRLKEDKSSEYVIA